MPLRWAVRVIGKGDKGRIVALPEAFGQVFGYWLADWPRDDFVLAKKPDDKPPGPRAVRSYLKRLVEKARIDKQVTPHKLRHTKPRHPVKTAPGAGQALVLYSESAFDIIVRANYGKQIHHHPNRV